jgi:methionyl-tRNA formyltransferase
MKVVLAAEEWAGLQVLRALADSPHQVVGVFTTPPKAGPEKRFALWDVARGLGFPTWPAKLVKHSSTAQQLRQAQVDIVLNVHSLHIIHADVLAVLRLGAFNLHPGPLPRYAGLNSVSWAIYNGEKSHGVTIHRMDRGIDTGDIAYQALFAIDDEDTALSLSFKCTQKGVPLMLKLLEVASSTAEGIPQIPQDLSRRVYFGAAVPEDGYLSWASTAANIVNFIRACDYFPFHSPWGHAKTQFAVRQLEIMKARRTHMACDAEPGTVGKLVGSSAQVATADEWILVEKLRTGGNYFAPTDLLKPGDHLGAAVGRMVDMHVQQRA